MVSRLLSTTTRHSMHGVLGPSRKSNSFEGTGYENQASSRWPSQTVLIRRQSEPKHPTPARQENLKSDQTLWGLSRGVGIFEVLGESDRNGEYYDDESILGHFQTPQAYGFGWGETTVLLFCSVRYLFLNTHLRVSCIFGNSYLDWILSPTTVFTSCFKK